MDESELSLEDQEDSPKLIKIPTITKKGKRVSPKKRRKSVDKSLSPDFELDISDERDQSDQEKSEFNKVQILPSSLKVP